MEPPPESLFLTILSLFRPVSFEAMAAVFCMLILLLFSGLISGSEVAFFSIDSIRKESLVNSDRKNAALILLLLERPKRLLATILIANNFINVAIIILSSFIVQSLFDFSDSKLMGFLFQVVFVTFLILLFGEVIPKVYANNNALKLSSLTAYPLSFLIKIFYPLSSALIKSTNIIDKRIKKKGDNISIDELSHALELTTEKGRDKEEEKILTGIVKFGSTDVKQIMTPRMDVFTFENNENFQAVKELVLEANFSRIPVFCENFDKIEGILYVKDLLPHLNEGINFRWQKLLRPALFVPENKKIDDLLIEFQEKKTHIAVVVDEYGGSSGVICLEDIIEEIVGDISDEFDDDDITYSKLDENNFIFEGKIALNDFYKLVEIEGENFEKAKGESDSLAGFIIELAGKIPIKGETFEFENFSFKIESANARKINTIKVTMAISNAEDDDVKED